ncbi:hypothetical protein KSP39_PZI016560 [Platanthera zijinensis]|uniref:Uncharacterized protein n=1 Tax=Platanthera zijinensis TaxID=2320716 RepID=A0AAP0G0Y5_9ASPA
MGRRRALQVLLLFAFALLIVSSTATPSSGEGCLETAEFAGCGLGRGCDKSLCCLVRRDRLVRGLVAEFAELRGLNAEIDSSLLAIEGSYPITMGGDSTHPQTYK